MEIKYHDKTKLIFEDENRQFTFLDLAILGYKIEGEPKHFWVLYEYKDLYKDKVRLTLGTTFHYNCGRMSQIYFGYYVNDIIRRTLRFDEEGIIKEDKIIFFNPRSFLESDNYYAMVPTNTLLEDYISDDIRYYDTYDKEASFRNVILDDRILKDYLYYNNRYANLLNNYCDRYDILETIISRFEDEWYLRDLERTIKNNKVKTLEK